MMTFWNQVCILLWRNHIMHRQRWFVLFFEVIAPPFFCGIFIFARHTLPLEHVKEALVFNHKPLSPPKVEFEWTANTIGYAPSGHEVQELMANVRILYGKHSAKSKSDALTFKGFVNEEAMEKYVHFNPSRILLCLVFLNVGVNETAKVPKNLRFAIRPTTSKDLGPWNTDRLFDGLRDNTHDEDDRYQYSGVLFMQKIVGESLINFWLKRIGGDPETVQFVVTSHRFAMPPHTNDPMIMMSQIGLPLALLLTMVFNVIINTKDLVFEKEKKLKETMLLMGLKPSAHWVAWFLSFLAYQVFVVSLFTVTLGVNMYERCAVLCHSNEWLLFLFLFIYGLSTIAFCFMLASMFQKAKTAAVMAGILFVVSITPFNLLMDDFYAISKGRIPFIALFSNSVMAFGAFTIGLYEATGEGVQPNNFYKPPNVNDNWSLLDIMVVLVVDTIAYLLVAWYLENVTSRTFGSRKPYNFCFTKSYWTGHVTGNPDPKPTRTPEYKKRMSAFEQEPKDSKVGISIKGLTKVFNQKTVVSDLNLNLYEGQITVLLGHNGAGKTTTLSMLTGFTHPTEGTAEVNGHDVIKSLQKARKSISMCPHHLVLFEQLTVTQNLTIFASLKDTTKCRVKKLAPIIEDFGLQRKQHTKASSLSAGERRKLSVAVALVVGAKVVLLDEPTAGLDPNSRRQVWDALQRYREGRTVLLTTHLMEEADVLGDRIAIITKGVLRCCGSSMFLEKFYGTGYHLEVVVKDTEDIGKISKIVQDHIKSAYMESKGDTKHATTTTTNPTAAISTITNATSATSFAPAHHEVSYLLPASETGKFPDLLAVLETKRDKMGIVDLAMAACRMEDVFLKVTKEAIANDHGEHIQADKKGNGQPKQAREEADSTTDERLGPTTTLVATSSHIDGLKYLKPSVPVDATKRNSIHDVSELLKKYKKLTGIALAVGRMRGILWKKVLYTQRNRIYSFVQFALPVLLVAVEGMIGVGNELDPPLTLNLDNYPDRVIVPMMSHKTSRLKTVYGEQFDNVSNVVKEPFTSDDYWTFEDYTMSLAVTLGGGEYNKRMVVGFYERQTISDSRQIQATSYHNGDHLHANPIGVNLLMNAFVKYYLNESYSLQGVLHPLRMHEDLISYDYDVSKSSDAEGTSHSVTITLAMAFLVAMYAYYYINERKVGYKVVERSSGVSPLVYWVPSFLWDMGLFLVPCLAIPGLYVIIYNSTSQAALASFYLLLSYGWVALPFTYLVQFLFRHPGSGLAFLLCLNIFTGLVCIFVLLILDVFVDMMPRLGDAVFIADMLLMVLFPCYNVGKAFGDIHENDFYNNYCKGMPCSTPRPHPCCSDSCGDVCFKYHHDFLALEKPGVGWNVVTFFIEGLVYFVLLFLLEYRVPRTLFCFGSGHTISVCDKFPRDHKEDSDVAAERKRLNEITVPELCKTDALILRNLHKAYYSDVLVVNSLCLGIRKKECFGLLGQNGSGKTTIFKMLTGEVGVTSGNAYLEGCDVRDNLKMVKNNIGYCPENNALLSYTTVREMLTLYAFLKGVSKGQHATAVDDLMRIMMLETYADFMVGDLSEGCQRKLCTAIALVGMPGLIFLDEPSRGMDPQTRKLLWNVLSQLQAHGHTILFSSQNMEECESVCTRLAIMVNGSLACLGTPQHIRDKFARGYTLIVRMVTKADPLPLIDYIKHFMPQLKVFEDHRGYVHIQVGDPYVELSDIFGVMEAIKKYFALDDYSVHQTSLEQVFLSLTR